MLIGDCETAARVGPDGSIEWLCWPRFDSPAVTLPDFMPIRDGASDLMRIVIGHKREVTLGSALTLGFDCGNLVPWVDRAADDTLLWLADNLLLQGRREDPPSTDS